MTDARDWLESKDLDELEEAEATRDDPNHVLLQNKAVVEHGDEWISYRGSMMDIEQ